MARQDTLDRQRVAHVVSTMLRLVPEVEVRLVGTASSVLRGIEIPAADIDVLFRDRAAIDAWCAMLSNLHDVQTHPTWLDGAQQYFCRLEVEGVTVELSTVEIETEATTMECFGSGPWRRFDVLACGDATIAAVSSELRLLTEVSRGRVDRWQPIARSLSVTGFDLGLIQQGLAEHEVGAEVSERVMRSLARAPEAPA